VFKRCSKIARAQSILIDRRTEGLYPNAVDKWPLSPADMSKCQFPLLEQLELEFPSNSQNSNARPYHHTSDILYLPPMHAPRLRHLRLLNFYTPFYGSTLLSLVLQRDYRDKGPLPTPFQFLAMIQSCPQLQTLRLCRWIPNLALPSEPTILLPQLAMLSIADTISRGVAFCLYITTPSATVRHLNFTEVPAEPEQYLGLLERCLRSSGTLSTQIWAMAIDMHHRRTAALMGPQNLGWPSLTMAFFSASALTAIEPAMFFDSPDYWEDPQADPIMQLNLISASGHDCIDSAYVVELIIKAFGLGEHLEFFRLDIGDYFSHDWQEWRTALCTLTRVHTVTFCPEEDCEDVNELCTLLRVQPPTPARAAQLVFPSLRRLSVLNLALSVNYCSGTWTAGYKFQYFEEMLTARLRAGAGITRLSICFLLDEATAGEEALRRLRQTVPDIDCRHIERPERNCLGSDVSD
jgi:hypothetical protein